MLTLKQIGTRLLQRVPLSNYPYKPFMHKHKCIFIHIPKNAGSSVLALFNDTGGRKHAKYYDFYEANDYFYQQYHKFAIIREPFNRLYSAYKYAASGGNQSIMDVTLQQTIDKRCSDFEGFINNVLCYDFVMQQPLFLPQYLYIFDRQLNCSIDSILTYENLVEDWHNLAMKLTLPTKLPWKNPSKQSAMPRLAESALEKVKEIYHFDYQLLDYVEPIYETS